MQKIIHYQEIFQEFFDREGGLKFASSSFFRSDNEKSLNFSL